MTCQNRDKNQTITYEHPTLNISAVEKLVLITPATRGLTQSAAVVNRRHRSDELHTGLAIPPVQAVSLRDRDRETVGMLKLRRQTAARDRAAVQSR